MAGARLPLQDGVFRSAERKWAFTEIVPFGEDFSLGVSKVLTPMLYVGKQHWGRQRSAPKIWRLRGGSWLPVSSRSTPQVVFQNNSG